YSGVFLALLFGFFLWGRYYWGAGFLYSILELPRLPFSSNLFLQNWMEMARKEPFLFLLLFMWIYTSFLSPNRRNWKPSTWSPLSFYILFTFLWTCITTTRLASSANHFFELQWALALFFFLDFWKKEEKDQRKDSSLFSAQKGWILLLLFSLIFWGWTKGKESPYDFSFYPTGKKSYEKSIISKTVLRASGISYKKPLVLCEPAWNLFLTNKIRLNDPVHMKSAAEAGHYDDRPFLEALQRKDYDLLVLRKGYIEGFYPPSWMQRIYKNYYLAFSCQGYYFFLPRR
ncbi:MAG: hypothetical protein D6785_02660, partial [Planctomycetota bacterium]